METLIRIVRRSQGHVVQIEKFPGHINMTEVIKNVDFPLEVELKEGVVIIFQKNESWDKEFAQKIANSLVTALKIFTTAGFRYAKFGM